MRDNANKSLDEQVALFSKLVMADSKRPIYRVWSRLDPVAHSVVMSQLGLFDGKVRAQYYEWARQDAAELKRHTRMLKTFLMKQVEHENIAARRPRFYMPRRYSSEPEVRATLGKVLEMEIMHLKRSVADINRRLKARSKWDPRGMILSQEYVKRRVDFLGISGHVRLTLAAIADIYQLTQRTRRGGDDPGTVDKIRKAIDYFKKNPENAYLIQNIEIYLDDWKKPISKPESRN